MNQSLSSLINNALCIISRVTSAMLVISDTYTRELLFVCVNGHRGETSSVRKHYDSRHAGRIPDDFHSCFNVLKKC